MDDSFNIALRQVSLFKGMTDDEFALISSVAQTRRFPKNSVVLRKGDLSNALYVVHSGVVKVVLGDADGREVILALLRVGEYFGEMALIDEYPRSADVIAMENSQLIVISKSSFVGCLERNWGMALGIMVGLAQKLRQADRKIESLALMDVYGRVARTLLELAELEDGRLVIVNKLSQQNLADMIGASREMVGRILKDLTHAGHIQIEGKKIFLRKLGQDAKM